MFRPVLLAAIAVLVHAGDAVTVFAAASLTRPMDAITTAYTARTGVVVRCSYAASSTLAKQIENGAPADIFISADVQWFDYLAKRKLLKPDTRRDLLANRLVIIAPKDRPFNVTVDKGFNFPAAFTGRFAVGDPAGVPIGRYCQQAFTQLGWWDRIQPRLAPAPDVRAGLKLVEAGECDAGVVYATDAKGSAQVVILAEIPDNLHDPVVYPFAITANAGPAAQALLDHLAGAEALAVFAQANFTVLAAHAPPVR